MRAALVANGLDFIEKSIKELNSEPKFSVSHFATGVELLLKSRLFSEHWSLVSARPHSTAWTAVKDGEFVSVQASDLTKSLSAVTATYLAKEQEVFKSVFEHRNQALHFVPSQDVGGIAAEQFRSWFYLHRLLTTTWNEVYATASQRIESVDESLRAHRDCLRVRFEELTKAKRFTKPSHTGNLTDCPICKHHSGILDDAKEHVTNLECPVCVTELEMANFGCGHWHNFSDGFFPEVDCDCGRTHGASDLAELMDDQQPMSPKEASVVGDTRAHCGECLTNSCVVRSGGEYRCFACGECFSDDALDQCGWCNEAWVGYDCSNTAWNGCENCDGREGWDKD